MKGKKILAACLAVSLLAGVTACGDGSSFNDIVGSGGGYPEVPLTETAVDCATIVEDDAQQERWLSIPQSRLVINPFQYRGRYNNIDVSSTTTQSQLNNSAALPLNLGWLHPVEGQKMPNFVSVLSEQEDGTRIEANSYTTAWRPDRLECEASYDTGAYFVGRDYFYDEKTIVRDFVSYGGNVTFWGTYDVMDFYDWYEDDIEPVVVDGNTLYFRDPGNWYNAALTFNGPGRLLFYNTRNDLLDNVNGSAEPIAGSGIWCYIAESDRAVMSVSIDVSSGDIEELVELSRAPFVNNAYLSAMNMRTNAWNELLSKVPAPSSFALDSLGYEGADETLIRTAYYKSWALLLSNALPASPESDYPYPQLANGKPSMWNEGHRDACYTAAWESLFGMSFLAMVEPELAWDCFLGYMTLVDDTGMLAGESLPSNKATAAWTLYEAAPDAEKLLEAYPALERYMNWRLENPRWILEGSHDDAEEKDMDFSAALLVDIRQLIKICNELAEQDSANAAKWTAAAAEWKQKADEHYEDMCGWFFPLDHFDSSLENLPKQYWYPDGRWVPDSLNQPGNETAKLEKARGASLWVMKCLWADQPYDASLTEKTGKDTRQILLDYYDYIYNENASFVGMSNIKYDEYMYTAYGLIRSGRYDQAAKMIEAGYRDVARTRFLAEQYQSTTIPSCDASCVRPSLFGPEILIDCLLLKNGFFYHDGGISIVNLFEDTETERGVSNIVIGGVTYDLRMQGTGYTLSSGGTVVKQGTLTADDGIVKIEL